MSRKENSKRGRLFKSPNLGITFRTKSEKDKASVDGTDSELAVSPRGSSLSFMKLKLDKGESQGSLISMFGSPSKQKRDVTRTKSKRSKSKLVRGGVKRNVGDLPIASEKACLVYVGEPAVVGLIRPFPSFKLQVYTRVAKKSKDKTQRQSSCNKIVDFVNGTIRFMEYNKDQGSVSKFKGAETVYVANLCGLFHEKDTRFTSFDVRTADPRSEKDAKGHRSVQSYVTYIMKFSTNEQAEQIARSLMKEACNYGIMIDLALGWMENGNRMKPEVKAHLGCLLRKRVDLFLIGKPSSSKSLAFAIDRLIDHFKEKEEDAYTLMWTRLKQELVDTESDDPTGLLEMQNELLQEQKEDGFSHLMQRLEQLFAVNKYMPEATAEITSSFYGKLYREKNLLEEAD